MFKVISEIYKYRELLKNNVKKEIRGKYKNSILGVLWTFLNPLLQIAVYATIFSLILSNTPPNYAIFVCVGLIPWTFFTTSITQAAFTIVGNGNIVKKVYFPREILPLSVVLSGAVNFAISALIIVGFAIFSGIGLSWHLVFLPVILLIQILMQLAIAFVISAVTVYIRDVEHFIQIALMMLFYATPIVYSTDKLPPTFQKLLNLNPMTAIIEGYRSIFYSQTIPNFKYLGVWAVVSLVMLVVGWMIFNKLQKGFAEEL